MMSGALALSMFFSANIKAEEIRVQPLESDSVFQEVTERGEYVICVGDRVDSSIEQTETMQEIANDPDHTLYEADLSDSQLQQLEQTEHIQIEENFFLFGAASDQNTGKELLKEYLAEKEEVCTEWNYQMIRADKVAREKETQKATVKVAVLDSGIELLSGIPVSGSVNLVKEEQDLPSYMNDMVGHGTAAADIIYQICPEAQIYSVRVLDKDNKGRLSDVVEGIYWCIEHKMDIINMSFGTWNDSEILKKAIQAASDQGIMIIASAGNDAKVEYPAAFDEVMAIGSVDTKAQKAEDSASGPEVELTAPGEQIMTKSMLGMKTVSSGTSMAAPHVTGAAAFLMQQDNENEAAKIRFILDQSGNPSGDSNEYGYGVLDLEYAQQLLKEDVEWNVQENRENAEIQPNDEEEREPVPTFEDVDYVEGRWKGTNHKSLTGDAANDVGGFTAAEIKLLKAGAVLPDQIVPNGKFFPEWHGHRNYNYIANYRFATKIAKEAGDTAALEKVKGQDTECYNRMKKTVKIGGILQEIYPDDYDPNEGITILVTRRRWDDIILDKTGLDYSAQTAATQKKWRKALLYGMAIHTATDAFAHCCFFRNSGDQMQVLLHPDADDPSKYPNRYKAAGYIAIMTAYNYDNNCVGDVTDFSAYGETYWKGFYLGNILNYALQANNGFDAADINTWFKGVNYTFK